MDLSTVVGVLTDPRVIALVSPLLVSQLKKYVGSLPKAIVPLLSVVVGAVAAALGGADVADGAAAGLAGVGIREIVDQGKKTLIK